MMDKLVCSLVIFGIALVCYYNSLGCGFVFDDISAIKENKDLRPETAVSNLFWNDFWGTPMRQEKSHKSYRPLCVATFRFNYAISQLEPMTYHLVNNILHAIVCVLFYRLCEMFLSQLASFMAAILFAVHPIHTEAVTGVVGRAELLSSIFYLAALMMYAKCTGHKSKTVWNKLLVTILLVTAAMLCKEQGITVIGVCCVYEVFIAQKMKLSQLLHIVTTFVKGKPYFPGWLRNAVVRAVVLVGTTLFLLIARIKVMGAQLPVFTRFDNPASVSPTPTRQLTFNYLLPVNAWLLLSPSELCCDWTMGTVPVITSLLDPRNLATLFFYVVLGKFVRYALMEKNKRARVVIMSLALMVLPFVPASNMFFPVGFVVAERVLYAPSMGFCMLVALGFDLLLSYKKQLKVVLWLGMTLLLLTHSVKTVVRNFDWESEYLIFMAGLRVNERNAKLFNNVGHALENDDKYAEAFRYFSYAAKVQPDDIGAHINIGRALKNLERFSEAEAAYRRALDLFPPIRKGQSYTARIAPNHMNVFINLANLISKDESRLLEADALYKTALSMRADFVQAYINRGDILLKLNQTRAAQDQYLTAIKHEPDNPDIYYNLGIIMIQEKKHQEALQYFEKALQLNPDHKHTLHNSATLLQDLGSPKLRPQAYKRLHRLLELEPDNDKAYFNLGMLSMDDKKYTQAEKYFKKAVELKSDLHSAYFNLALMLNNDMDRPLDAAPYLEKLLEMNPRHTKGLILMGDININNRKDITAAERNYLTILEYDPYNVQANHNLCVVYVEQGELEKAETCLAHTVQLAPEEDYVKKHLSIVRGRIQNKRAANQHQTEQQQRQGNQAGDEQRGHHGNN